MTEVRPPRSLLHIHVECQMSGNAYPTMELRQSSQTTPDCCPMGRVTQFRVNADLVLLLGDACVEGLP